MQFLLGKASGLSGFVDWSDDPRDISRAWGLRANSIGGLTFSGASSGVARLGSKDEQRMVGDAFGSSSERADHAR